MPQGMRRHRYVGYILKRGGEEAKGQLYQIKSERMYDTLSRYLFFNTNIQVRKNTKARPQKHTYITEGANVTHPLSLSTFQRSPRLSCSYEAILLLTFNFQKNTSHSGARHPRIFHMHIYFFHLQCLHLFTDNYLNMTQNKMLKPNTAKRICFAVRC